MCHSAGWGLPFFTGKCYNEPISKQARFYRMKLFFLDIDGTIAVPGTAPSERLHKTISALQAQGDKVFLCTGRTCAFTLDNVKALGCDGGIFSAGGLILGRGGRNCSAPICRNRLRASFFLFWINWAQTIRWNVSRPATGAATAWINCWSKCAPMTGCKASYSACGP